MMFRNLTVVFGVSNALGARTDGDGGGEEEAAEFTSVFDAEAQVSPDVLVDKPSSEPEAG